MNMPALSCTQTLTHSYVLVLAFVSDWSNKDPDISLSYYQTAMGNANPATSSFIGLNHETIASTTIGVNGGAPSIAKIIDYGEIRHCNLTLDRVHVNVARLTNEAGNFAFS